MEGNRNSHEHCSDCENQEDNSYNWGGLSPANDTGAKKKKKKQNKKKKKRRRRRRKRKAVRKFQPLKINSLPTERIQEIQKAFELFSLSQRPSKTIEEASKRSYQFRKHSPSPNWEKW